MIVKTISGNEQTITTSTVDDVQVDNVTSFQNKSAHAISWSSKAFDTSNSGSVLTQNDERVFTEALTIYFKKSHVAAPVQCRSVTL